MALRQETDVQSPTGSLAPLPDADYFFEPLDEDEGDPDGPTDSTTRPTIRSDRSGSVPIVAYASPSPASTKLPTMSLQTSRMSANNQEKKMHQTSTRIMRTNPDGRPFASVSDPLPAFSRLLERNPDASDRLSFRTGIDTFFRTFTISSQHS